MISFKKPYTTVNNYDNMQNKNYGETSLLIETNKHDAIVCENKLLAKRTCKLQNYIPVDTKSKAQSIFQTISLAIEKSQIGTVNFEINQSILPNLSFRNDHCFFKAFSENIQKLIIDDSLTLSEKFKMIDKISTLLKKKFLSDNKLFYVERFLLSVCICLQITCEINLNTVLIEPFQQDKLRNKHNYILDKGITSLNGKNDYTIISRQLLQYPISIDLLFIEEERRFISKNNSPNQIIDLGAHAFDNEWLYMERCYRGFTYLLDKQITKISQIKYDDLRDVNAILGGYTVPNQHRVEYGCDIPRDYGTQFINLVKQGIICDVNFEYSRDDMNSTERMLELEFFLYCSLGVDIKLKEIIFKGCKYFIIKLPANQDSDLTITSFEKQLFDDLHGITDNKAFIFSIIKINDEDGCDFYVKIQYCYYRSREETCKTLLDRYYEEIKDLPNIVQKVKLAVTLCSLLQRIHPFVDGNGRTLFFILFPVLLYQMGLWLIRMVRDPWVLLELDHPDKLAGRILKMCTSAPEFKSTIGSWDEYLTIAEKMRINCALGNIEAIKNLLEKYPDLIFDPIVNAPVKVLFNILDFSIIQKQYKVFLFLFNEYPKNKLTFKFLFSLMELSVEYNQIEIQEYLLDFMKKTYSFSLPVIINNKIFI